MKKENDGLAKVAEVRLKFRTADATIDRRLKAGLIPPPVTTILGTRYWSRSEIDAVEGAMLRGAHQEEIKSLVASLKAARSAASLAA